jgi:hypothetical protein
MTAALEALRAALAAGHWYCLSASGQAMLCVNEEDARNEAEECDSLYPQHGPHRAVQLVPAAPELLAEVDRLKAEREALLRYYTASRRVINTIGHPEATAADEHAAEAEFDAATAAARAALKEQA